MASLIRRDIIVLLFATPLLLIFLHHAYRLFSNYLAAKRLGLPIIIVPFTWQHPLWLAVAPFFAWVRRLPCGLGEWWDYSQLGWPLNDSHETHKRLGDALVIVSSAENEVMLADAESATEVITKWKTWMKPPVLYSAFDLFGDNLISTNGEEWPRHRKITSTVFREQNYKLVWEEAAKQTKQMLEVVLERDDNTMQDVRDCFVTIAMHVLSAAGLGHVYEFSSGVQRVKPGHTQSYAAALTSVLTNLPLVLVLRGLNLPAFLLPRKLRAILTAVAEVKLYMREAVEEQLDSEVSKFQGKDIVSALVRANQESKTEQKASEGRPLSLTDDELYGNLFVLSLAGFETTATSLAYTIPHLALRPDVQEWIQEEVDIHLRKRQTGVYEDTFPLLVRCMSLMYETLRLHGPAAFLGRSNPTTPLPLSLPDKTIVIPANTYISPNLYALHSDSRHWGADAQAWNPKRWIERDPSTRAEKLKAPPSGAAFVPWATGPRGCPGKKFSQVEFVAVICSIMADCQLEPMKMKKGQSRAEATELLLEVVRDSSFKMSPRMNRPREAGVVFLKRR